MTTAGFDTDMIVLIKIG